MNKKVPYYIKKAQPGSLEEQGITFAEANKMLAKERGTTSNPVRMF
jgi:hypothetical protein